MGRVCFYKTGLGRESIRDMVVHMESGFHARPDRDVVSAPRAFPADLGISSGGSGRANLCAANPAGLDVAALPSHLFGYGSLFQASSRGEALAACSGSGDVVGESGLGFTGLHANLHERVGLRGAGQSLISEQVLAAILADGRDRDYLNRGQTKGPGRGGQEA